MIRISVSPEVSTSTSQLNLEEIVEAYSHGIYETDPLYLDRKWLVSCKSSGRTWHTIFSAVRLLALGPWQALEVGIQGIFVRLELCFCGKSITLFFIVMDSWSHSAFYSDRFNKWLEYLAQIKPICTSVE